LKAAIVVIDMINDFITGKLKCSRAVNIIPNIQRLLDFARKKGIPVIYACDSHVANIDREFDLWGPHAVVGTSGSEIIPEIKPREGDYVVAKRRYSAFFGTDLDLLLSELAANTLILTGVSTDVCVQNTAADAFFRGYKIIVPEDCVEAFTEQGHREALDYMGRVYGAQIMKLEELIRRLEE
jgi:nicotinamidase-related amidase